MPRRSVGSGCSAAATPTEPSPHGWSSSDNRSLAELDNVEAELRRRHPDFAALSRPEPLSADQIRSLLDPATILLEYALGEERSFVWVVTADSTAVFELPARHDIERVALRLHHELSTPDPRAMQRERSTAAELSRMVLGPASEMLASHRLAVVADGALHYIPFAALPSPVTGSGPATPLLVGHEIVHLPSASALALQRQTAGHRPAPRLAAVVADPVFGPDDPRLATDAASSMPRDGLLSQSTELDRLPLTRDEALAIAALASPGKVTTLLDFAANRSTVLSDQLARYRVVHFATHGVVNAELPELSGLALSRIDASGRPLEGVLRLRDIYNLRLAADLVVLSGCQTALGKEVRGEGLVGLTRGFMYAGAPRVVASLWWVQDRATAELMTHFYTAMWRESLPPAAALRRAQLALWQERRWQDPFYWAAFVHQGDWR